MLLAAGASTRLGEPKQLLRDADGVPAVLRVARAMTAVCDDLFVVVGASADEVIAALGDVQVRLVRHDAWRAGMGSSIAAGMHAIASDARFADAHRTSGVLIVPCDMPAVTTEHLRALGDAFDGKTRVASRYASPNGEVRGIPAVLPRSDWTWLASLDGDRGARPLFLDANTVLIALPDGAFDLDTPADVERWRHSTPNP